MMKKLCLFFLTIKLPKGNERECEMEKKEKSPAVMQGENRRLLIQASHKAARRISQNRVQQKYRKWRKKKRREYEV